jgi:hypothetical protein
MSQAAKRRKPVDVENKKQRTPDALSLVVEDSERIELTDDDILAATAPSAAPANDSDGEDEPGADSRETLPAPPDSLPPDPSESQEVAVPPAPKTPARLQLERCASRAEAVASELRAASISPSEGASKLEDVVHELGAIVRAAAHRPAVLVLHEDTRVRDRVMLALESHGLRVRAARGLMDLARMHGEHPADALFVTAPRDRSHEEQARLIHSLVADEGVPVVMLARDEVELRGTCEQVPCLPVWGTIDVLIECVGMLLPELQDPLTMLDRLDVDSLDVVAESGLR